MPFPVNMTGYMQPLDTHLFRLLKRHARAYLDDLYRKKLRAGQVDIRMSQADLVAAIEYGQKHWTEAYITHAFDADGLLLHSMPISYDKLLVRALGAYQWEGVTA